MFIHRALHSAGWTQLLNRQKPENVILICVFELKRKWAFSEPGLTLFIDLGRTFIRPTLSFASYITWLIALPSCNYNAKAVELEQQFSIIKRKGQTWVRSFIFWGNYFPKRSFLLSRVMALHVMKIGVVRKCNWRRASPHFLASTKSGWWPWLLTPAPNLKERWTERSPPEGEVYLSLRLSK